MVLQQNLIYCSPTHGSSTCIMLRSCLAPLLGQDPTCQGLPWSARFTPQVVSLCACAGCLVSARRMTVLSLQPMVSADPVPEELPELRVQSCLQVRPLRGTSDEGLDHSGQGATVHAIRLCFSAPRGTVGKSECSLL